MSPQPIEWPGVVGLDLSLTGTGVAHFTDNGFETHLIKSKGAKGDSLAERTRRLQKIKRDVLLLVPMGSLVVIEQPAYSQTGGSHHDRSGLWWLIVDGLDTHYSAVLDNHHSVVEIAPGTLKKFATGKGNAGKDEMLAAAIRRYPAAEVVDNNVADAVHLAAMGARYLGLPQEADTVKLLEAMAVPRWAA